MVLICFYEFPSLQVEEEREEKETDIYPWQEALV